MTTVLLAATLARYGRARSYEVCRTSRGWQARVREDCAVVHEQILTDWHRVERALARFTLEIAALRSLGWRDL